MCLSGQHNLTIKQCKQNLYNIGLLIKTAQHYGYIYGGHCYWTIEKPGHANQLLCKNMSHLQWKGMAWRGAKCYEYTEKFTLPGSSTSDRKWPHCEATELRGQLHLHAQLTLTLHRPALRKALRNKSLFFLFLFLLREWDWSQFVWNWDWTSSQWLFPDQEKDPGKVAQPVPESVHPSVHLSIWRGGTLVRVIGPVTVFLQAWKYHPSPHNLPITIQHRLTRVWTSDSAYLRHFPAFATTSSQQTDLNPQNDSITCHGWHNCGRKLFFSFHQFVSLCLLVNPCGTLQL